MKLRVLHCIYSLGGGGAERQLSLLCRHGAKYNLENITFHITGDVDAQEVSRALVRYNRKSKIDLGIFGALARAIDDVGPQIIHAWLPPVVTIPALLVGWWKNVPVIVSYRNVKSRGDLLSLLEYIFSWLFASGVASNTKIDFCSLWLRGLYWWKRGILVRNGVSVAAKQHLSDDRKFLKSGRLAILFAGRITRQKNWKCLLDALVIVKDEIPWSLSICGEGEDQEQIEEYIVTESMQDKISILGYRPDLYLIMADSDLLVLPSWYEGMPNVLVESFEIGLPCLVSDIPVHREIVGPLESEVCFPPDRPDVLAKKIVSLYEHPAVLKGMMIRGKSIARCYSVEQMTCQYSGYYRRVVELSNNGRANS